MKNLFIFSLINIIFLLSGCGEKYQILGSVISTAKNNPGHAADSICFDSTGKFYFSRVKIPSAAGLVASFKFKPGEVKETLCLVARGRSRSNFAQSNATVVFAVMDEDKQCLIWRNFGLRYFYTDVNQWCYYRDSIFIPAKTNGKNYSEITALAWLNPPQSESFDMDTLELIVKEKL